MTRARLLVTAAALVAVGGLSAFTFQRLVPATQHPLHRIVIGDGANGRRVAIRVGDELTVRLDSTYWTIASSPNPRVVATEGAEQVRVAQQRCVPGAGCGTATRSFLGKATGTVRLTATRTSCGEALRCTGASGRYSVRVLVLR